MSDEFVPVDTTPAPEPVASESIDDSPRGQRVIGETTRKAFQALVAAHKDVDGKPLETGEDLVPVNTTQAATVAAVDPAVQSAAVVPAPQAVAAPITEQPAVAADHAAKALQQQHQMLLEQREKQIADREAAHEAERAKLPSRDQWVENSATTIKSLVKQMYGIESDSDLKDAMADVISELTADALGTPLDPTHKIGIESRRATRVVKAYKSEQANAMATARAEQAKQAEAIKAEREQADQAQRERAAQAQLGGLLAPVAKDYPFLMANDEGVAPEAAVFAVLKSQRDEHQRVNGPTAQFTPDWPAAAKLANEFYKTRATNYVTRYQSLLAPAAPVAPPTVKPSPQVSTQVQRSTTQPAATTPQPDPAPALESSEERFDRHARRSRGMESLRKRFPVTPE